MISAEQKQWIRRVFCVGEECVRRFQKSIYNNNLPSDLLRVFSFVFSVRETQSGAKKRAWSVCVYVLMCVCFPGGQLSSSAQYGDKRLSLPHRPAGVSAQKAAWGECLSGHMVSGFSSDLRVTLMDWLNPSFQQCRPPLFLSHIMQTHSLVTGPAA